MKKKTVISILGCILFLAVGVLVYIFYLFEKEANMAMKNLPTEKENNIVMEDLTTKKEEHMVIADFPYYTFESAAAQAEYIFYGKVTEKGQLRFNEDQQPFTEVQVEVLESVKGDFDDTSMKYMEYGGETSTDIYYMHEVEPVEKGEEYIFFLTKNKVFLAPWTLLRVTDGSVKSVLKSDDEALAKELEKATDVAAYIDFIKEQTEFHVEVKDPVIMASATFDDYGVFLQMYEGSYQSDFNIGLYFGANWIGSYELAIVHTPSNKVVITYKLSDWNEPMCFQETFDLKLTDYDKDGNFEVLIGQYGTVNYNRYHMYQIGGDLRISYYSEIGEILISSREMSPELEVKGDVIRYSYYDNSKGKEVIKEIDVKALEASK